MQVFDYVQVLNRFVVRTIRFLCVCLLILMTSFIVYTVIMRYVFQDPPFWGDTLAVFANIWLVLMAFALAVYDRDHVSMQGMYDRLPETVAVVLRLLWDILILGMGIFMLVYGLVLVDNIRGTYYELASLPKKWPVMIVPLFGLLTAFAALAPIATDVRRLFARTETARSRR